MENKDTFIAGKTYDFWNSKEDDIYKEFIKKVANEICDRYDEALKRLDD